METKYFCPKCGTEMKQELDTQVVYCPNDQIAFMAELMKKLVDMAVDWRDTANEALHGPAGS